MWNGWNTADYHGMVAETTMIPRKGGKQLRAYYSRPLDVEGYPSIVLIPHMPGWDEFLREAARRFTEQGYAVVCPDIYQDFGTGTPPEVSKRVMESGGVSDESVMSDVEDSIAFMRKHPEANGKVGVIGMCSGGRHTFLAACTLDGIDAAVDCWGGAFASNFNPNAPIDKVDGLSCPLMGIFGNEDHWPEADEVNRMEEVLKEKGKDYTFYRYDGAGHGIWYYDKPMYRQEQAMDSWNKALEFFDKHLKTPTE